MNPELLPLALGFNRLLIYGGYVLLAGTLTFWVLVWPEGRHDRRLVTLTIIGIVTLAVSSVAGPMIEVYVGGLEWSQLLSPVLGAALLLRAAGLAGAIFFLTDILHYPIAGWRRLLPVAIVVAIACSFVMASNAVGGPWETVKIIATLGHILATGAWLGGLVALAAVLIPREYLNELNHLIPKFSVVAATSVALLLITGIIHALAIAGGVGALIESRYGLVFGIKVVIFAGMLVLGNHGRQYAARVAARAKKDTEGAMKQSTSVHSLAVVMGAELTIAFVILATTSILVMVAPTA